MASDATRPGPRAGRGVRIALVLSLALNVALVGAGAGLLAAHGPGRRPPPEAAASGPGFGPFTPALTEDDRGALRRSYAEAVRSGRAPAPEALRAAAEAERARLAEALRADPFDAAAVEAALNAQRSRLMNGIETGHHLIMQRIQALPPDARAAFAERLMGHAGGEHERRHRN